MKEIKKLLWFILPFMAWIGTKYVVTEAYIQSKEPSGIWWFFSSLFCLFSTIALIVLAGSKQ